MISVAHEEGNLNDLRAILGKRRNDQGLPGGEAFLPGRNNHCPARLELRPVRGKQQSLWPSPIFRGRPTQERGSVHGQGLKKIRLDRRLGFAQFNDGKPADVAVHNTCFSCCQIHNYLQLYIAIRN
jgi:hypothetical protein